MILLRKLLLSASGYALPVLRGVWKALWYPAALPVVFILTLAGLAIYFSVEYHQIVREAITYQDSIVKAQDTELWRLRGDTLQANFEIRELYKRLDEREKQEVIYFEYLRHADDSDLQAQLDSVFGNAVRSNIAHGFVGARAGQSAPYASGRSTAPEKFNNILGWGETSSARSFLGR